LYQYKWTTKRCCCAYNIVDCLVLESSLHSPTFQPTIIINENLCSSQTCITKYNIDNCYWYESINNNILCNENNNKYCCSEYRYNCCQTSKINVIIVFSCILCLIIFYIFKIYKEILFIIFINIINDTWGKYSIGIKFITIF
jgi:hypothetical protein